MKISIGGSPVLLIRGALGLLYPPRCEICQKGLELLSNDILCKVCYEGIKLNTYFSEENPTANLIRLEKTRYFDSIHSVGSYEGKMRECIHKFKYNGRLYMAKLFKELMSQFAERHMEMHYFDYLIPVPLHSTKYREREFNQSAILAHHLSKKFKVPYQPNNLARAGSGKAQSTLSRRRRISDIRGSFRIKRPSLIKGKKLLLVDDVFTTGATVNECSKVLKESGAEYVGVFTLARSR